MFLALFFFLVYFRVKPKSLVQFTVELRISVQPGQVKSQVKWLGFFWLAMFLLKVFLV